MNIKCLQLYIVNLKWTLTYWKYEDHFQRESSKSRVAVLITTQKSSKPFTVSQSLEHTGWTDSSVSEKYVKQTNSWHYVVVDTKCVKVICWQHKTIPMQSQWGSFVEVLQPDLIPKLSNDTTVRDLDIRHLIPKATLCSGMVRCWVESVSNKAGSNLSQCYDMPLVSHTTP